MANQKAKQNSIPLKTFDIDLNRCKSNIRPYSGFVKNNSPFYGDVLSPFYFRKYNVLNSNSYITKNGVIYSLINGKLNLVLDDRNVILDGTETKFATKEYLVSKNLEFTQILGFVPGYNNIGYEFLASNTQGKIAIIDNDGNVKYNFSAETNVTVYPDEYVYFVEKYNNAYCFAVSNNIYVIDSNGTIHYTPINNDRTGKLSYGCYKVDNKFIVCKYNNSVSAIYIIDTATGAISVVGTIQMYVNTSGTITGPTNYTQATWPLFFNKNGIAVLNTNLFRRQIDNQYQIFNFADTVRFVDDTTISFVTYNDNSVVADNLSEDKYESKSNVYDNYINYSILGYSNGGYSTTTTVTTTTPGYEKTYQVPILKTSYVKKRIPIPGTFPTEYIEYELPVTTVVGYNTYTEVVPPVTTTQTFSEHHPGGYSIILLDGSSKFKYTGVPLNSDGTYKGGLASNISSNLRILYHGGVAQAISMCNDNNTIGTLLCGMNEIVTTKPINSWVDAVGDEHLLYCDARGWVHIVITLDDTKANIKILNDTYILVNNTSYYNCYDTEQGRWFHFGSDWNDRAIFTAVYDSSTIPNNFDDYVNNCENYYFATAQGANTAALDIPFISSIFSSYAGMMPRNLTSINIALPMGDTPNDQDIDVYYGKQSVYGSAPIYMYSISQETGTSLTKYTNSKLSNSTYYYSFKMIPSIFAEFISGFINQGIIIDNGHSYIQVYQNNTKPIYAIEFVSQLEGVTNAFIIQGQYFVIINGSIYRYNNETSAVSPITNITGMELVGFTPYAAIFWSGANKTFYRFTGDNMIEMFMQATEINEIITSKYNPTTMSIYIVTDAAVYILSMEHLIKLNLSGFKKCYPLIYGCALVSETETILISYDKIEGYEPEPIELETNLYGEGNNIKSVNDCVYLRLFNNDLNNKSGKVLIRSKTLNEGSITTEEKTWNITPDMWDKSTNTVFLRYQPKNQAATGFSVYVKSPFCIASLDISNTPETVQNSKYNM